LIFRFIKIKKINSIFNCKEMSNVEEDFAVAQIKASAIKKQVNAASWNDD